MKLRTILSTLLAVGFAAGAAVSVQAFDIGGAVKGGAKQMAGSAVQNEYNKRLAKEKCRFVGDSATEFTGCDINRIISEMNAFKTAMEQSRITGDVDILVYTFGKDWDLASRRADTIENKVRAQVRSSWDYDVRYNKSNSNEVYFQVSVD